MYLLATFFTDQVAVIYLTIIIKLVLAIGISDFCAKIKLLGCVHQASSDLTRLIRG